MLIKFKAFVLAIFMAILPVYSSTTKAQETVMSKETQEAEEKKVQTGKKENSGFNFKKAIRVAFSSLILALCFIATAEIEIEKVGFLKGIGGLFGKFTEIGSSKVYKFNFDSSSFFLSLLGFGNFIASII